MEEKPRDPLDELGYNLTYLDLNEGSLLSSEKLLEVIQMELKYLILPQIAKGSIPFLEWSNGFTNIFISIHVEAEDQFSYSIEITNTP